MTGYDISEFQMRTPEILLKILICEVYLIVAYAVYAYT
tara:strand:- start:228 stop:341 length:114 start_codon:yes stop_codon:yes gene_type:complete